MLPYFGVLLDKILASWGKNHGSWLYQQIMLGTRKLKLSQHSLLYTFKQIMPGTRKLKLSQHSLLYTFKQIMVPGFTARYCQEPENWIFSQHSLLYTFKQVMVPGFTTRYCWGPENWILVNIHCWIHGVIAIYLFPMGAFFPTI